MAITNRYLSSAQTPCHSSAVAVFCSDILLTGMGLHRGMSPVNQLFWFVFQVDGGVILVGYTLRWSCNLPRPERGRGQNAFGVELQLAKLSMRTKRSRGG